MHLQFGHKRLSLYSKKNGITNKIGVTDVSKLCKFTKFYWLIVCWTSVFHRLWSLCKYQMARSPRLIESCNSWPETIAFRNFWQNREQNVLSYLYLSGRKSVIFSIFVSLILYNLYFDGDPADEVGKLLIFNITALSPRLSQKVQLHFVKALQIEFEYPLQFWSKDC